MFPTYFPRSRGEIFRDWLRLRLQEERTSYRTAMGRGGDASRHAGQADAFAEVLEKLGEPQDPLRGKPRRW